LTHYPGMSLKKEEFYEPLDFICGKEIQIFSRNCFIYNCDEFTKKFYKDYYGID